MLALAWAVAVSPAILPLGTGLGSEARAAGGVTVRGPQIWQPKPGDPKTGTYGRNGWVTVSQTQNLTNQVIHVSWTGFTPSVTIDGTPVVSTQPGNDVNMYPVRVYQCRGTKPDITDCYGSTLYGGDPTKGFKQPGRPAGTTTPEFPSNAVVTFTRPNKTGEADIEVWTAQQSQTLGCDPTHPCSIVVEAEYGGNATGSGLQPGVINCDDHSKDAVYPVAATDSVFNVDDGNTGQADRWRSGEACAWTHGVVIPLTFAPTPDNCPTRAADLSAQGLEMANRAMQQWSAGFCQGDNPLTIQYTSGGGEPQARSRFLAKTGADIALTARPDLTPAPRPYIYTPLANSAISVVFEVDDGKSSKQINQMKLNARLLAKMLTQSYQLKAPRDDTPSVVGNPICIFADPEFLNLNPVDPVNGPVWPSCYAFGREFRDSAPVVVGGTTDLVRQLTEWIASDPDASRFLQGAPDEWGMHIDTEYLRSKFSGYPTDSFVAQDSTGPLHWKQFEWNPVIGGLGQVLRKAIQAQPSCQDPNPDDLGNHRGCLREYPGNRQFFAILDAGQAQAMSLPQAALENPAGRFVAPTLTGMQAAVADMTVEPTTGTQQLVYGDPSSAFAKDQNAYPLTAVQYAMVPTAGVEQTKAASISQFVKRVTDLGEGQIYGWQPGRLAVGFLGLTNGQLKQAQGAMQHVAAQDGALPGNQAGPAAPPNAPGPDNSPATPLPGSAGNGGGSVANPFEAPSALGSGAAAGAGLGLSSVSSPGGSVGGPAGAPAGAGSTAAPSGKPSPSGSSAPGLAPIAAGQPAPDRAGLARVLLPTVLVLGAVLLIGGPAALALGGTAAGARFTAGVGRIWGRLTGSGS